MLIRAFLALALAAGLLLLAGVIYTSSTIPEVASRIAPRVIAGRELTPVVGEAVASGQQLSISEYLPRKHEYHAAAVWKGRLRAEALPLLRYEVDSTGGVPALKLIWRTASNPRALHRADLNFSGGVATMNMAENPRWRGTVVELGIYVVARDPATHVVIHGIRLEPRNWGGVLASYWSNWSAFRGWSVRTINFIYGTPDTRALSPTVVAGAWAALAAVLLLLAGLPGRSWQRGGFLVVILVPWLSLDLLWQAELGQQLQQARQVFGGRSRHEQHMRDMDAHIYSYIKRLKEEVLPAENQRILLLHNSSKHEFDRLKAQYYLLPHNVYNFGTSPPRKGLANLDYVLLLGDQEEVTYKEKSTRLHWGERGKLSVERVDVDPMGQLFRVTRGRVREGRRQ